MKVVNSVVSVAPSNPGHTLINDTDQPLKAFTSHAMIGKGNNYV